MGKKFVHVKCRVLLEFTSPLGFYIFSKFYFFMKIQTICRFPWSESSNLTSIFLTSKILSSEYTPCESLKAAGLKHFHVYSRARRKFKWYVVSCNGNGICGTYTMYLVCGNYFVESSRW